MKLHILFIGLIALTMTSRLSAQNYDFRKTRWGMDTTQVKKVETSKLMYSKQNTLVYKGHLSDWETEIVCKSST